MQDAAHWIGREFTHQSSVAETPVQPAASLPQQALLVEETQSQTQHTTQSHKQHITQWQTQHTSPSAMSAPTCTHSRVLAAYCTSQPSSAAAQRVE